MANEPPQDDRTAAELLSKSLRCQLSDAEQRALKENLDGNEEATNFAELSRIIQATASEVAQSTSNGTDPTIETGLSVDAKKRLAKSVRLAQQEFQSAHILNTENATLDRAVAPMSGTRMGDGRDTLSRFTMLRMIGEGGLGSVWLARDEELNRTVAIKEMLLEKSNSPQYLERFRREAMITGLLEHPNVVPLYMFGVDSESGKPFYAMRFLGKQTLDDAIEEYHVRRKAGHTGAIDLHRLLTVFLDVCQAIAYAHSRGVVHRDLKPDNVALDSFGQVIVLDWGIAKVLNDGELAVQASLSTSDNTDLLLTKTVHGEIIGTPLYMAPEQASGALDEIDERTDVFGLGAILYAILSGQAPHQQSSLTTEDLSLKERLKIIAQAPIPLPRDFDSQVPREIEDICMRAMSQHRYTRHSSAKELAEDVERWMAGQNDKRRVYEAMKLEANSIRVNLQSCIRDFGTNTRFVATLPPINGLIDAANNVDGDSEEVWRERLSTIFRGLLRSNQDFQAVAYNRIVGEDSMELVRVERSGQGGEARAVPRSRLTQAPVSMFEANVIANKPDDVYVSINQVGDRAPLLLQAGVPIFDREEEPFGLVLIEGNFTQLIENRIGRNESDARVVVVDDAGQLIFDGARSSRNAVGSQAKDVLRGWTDIQEPLDCGGTYEDPSNELFAASVGLCTQRNRGITVVLQANEKFTRH